ncbi:MAG: hypothetical protein Q8O38_11865 [Sulfurimicrobium sp.]|nr:hypothetical protein [Sulfurimicrobium sp.]
MAQFIQQTIRLDSQGYNLKRNAALNFKRLVFIVVPAKWFHVFILAWRVPIVTFLLRVMMKVIPSVNLTWMKPRPPFLCVCCGAPMQVLRRRIYAQRPC